MLKPQTPDTFGTTIFRLWTFVFLTMIFRDLHELSTARAIEGILAGTYEGNPVTDQALLFGGITLVVMLLTAVLSGLLVPAVARRLNLAVTPFAIAGGFYLLPNDPDDYLLGATTTAGLAAIFIVCWMWRPSAAALKSGEVRHAI